MVLSFNISNDISHLFPSYHIIYYIVYERRFILFEEPYIGMPIKFGNAHSSCCETISKDTQDFNNFPLAMSYVPFQKWSTTYPLEKALMRGTLFPDLDLPFKGGMRR